MGKLLLPCPDRPANKSKFLICSHSAIEWREFGDYLQAYHVNELNSGIDAQIHNKSPYKRLFIRRLHTYIFNEANTVLAASLHLIL